MGNVMLSIDEETEKLLRRLAHVRYGGKKGAISKVVSEALQKYDGDDENEKLRKRFFARMQKGLSFEYKMYGHRSEIYD